MAERHARDRRHRSLVPSSCSVTSRVESVCSARCDQVEQQPRLADQVGGVRDVLRRLRVHLRLRLLRPLLGLRQPLLQFADAGEVLVELLAVAGADAPDAPPSPGRRPRRGCSGRRAGGGPAPATSSGRPSRNSLANTLDGPRLRRHQRAAARPRQAEPFARQRAGWGSASASPMCSAANWSSEMLLRKPARRSGCGAAVRKLKIESWPDPTSGCDSPEMHREVVAEVLQRFEVRRERVVLAGLLREEVRRVQAERRADADHPPRHRGGARAGAVASSSGSASDTPAAWRT